MEKTNFIALINAITGRDFNVDNDLIECEKEYLIYRVLPITKRKISFIFKTPKNEENLIRSFVNQFCKKYKEPNPKAYTNNGLLGYVSWEDKTEEDREYCYMHHSSNMFNDDDLMEQIKSNLEKSTITEVWCRYGFYSTNYGVGIFVLFSGEHEMAAINNMKDYLNKENIIYKNEFSEKLWVYRFVLSINKEIHSSVLKGFNNHINNLLSK